MTNEQHKAFEQFRDPPTERFPPGNDWGGKLMIAGGGLLLFVVVMHAPMNCAIL